MIRCPCIYKSLIDSGYLSRISYRFSVHRSGYDYGMFTCQAQLVVRYIENQKHKFFLWKFVEVHELYRVVWSVIRRVIACTLEANRVLWSSSFIHIELWGSGLEFYCFGELSTVHPHWECNKNMKRWFLLIAASFHFLSNKRRRKAIFPRRHNIEEFFQDNDFIDDIFQVFASHNTFSLCHVG